jgi:DNA-binding transcriptional ArsR family regulator
MSRILEHGNRLEHAYLLLYFIADGTDLNSLKEKQLSQSMDESFDMEKKFDALIHIYTYVSQALESEKSEIQRLFKGLAQNYSTYAGLSMLWNSRSFIEDINAYHDKLQETNFEGRIKEFIRILDDQEAAALKDNEPKDIEEFMKFLELSECNKEDCFEILKILFHPEDYFEPTRRLLTRTMELLEDCSAELNFLERSFYEYWTEYEKTQSIIQTIKTYINVEYPDSKKGTIVRAKLFHPHSISLSLDDGKHDEEDVVDLGILVNRYFTFNFSRLLQSDVIKIGKVFSDKSKLDILDFVKKTPAFGREIASKMNLTTATISYHVNSLVELGFLKTSVDSGRVYYQTNVERIKEVLKELEQFVTLELT